jgi:hypothetical protein
MIKPGPKAKIDPLEVAKDYLIRNHPGHVVAKLHGCSRMTVHRAVKAVESMDTPEAATIRRLAAIRH